MDYLTKKQPIHHRRQASPTNAVGGHPAFTAVGGQPTINAVGGHPHARRTSAGKTHPA